MYSILDWYGYNEFVFISKTNFYLPRCPKQRDTWDQAGDLVDFK